MHWSLLCLFFPHLFDSPNLLISLLCPSSLLPCVVLRSSDASWNLPDFNHVAKLFNSLPPPVTTFHSDVQKRPEPDTHPKTKKDWKYKMQSDLKLKDKDMKQVKGLCKHVHGNGGVQSAFGGPWEDEPWRCRRRVKTHSSYAKLKEFWRAARESWTDCFFHTCPRQKQPQSSFTVGQIHTSA